MMIDHNIHSILAVLEGSNKVTCPELQGAPFVQSNRGSLIGTLARMLILDGYNPDRILIVQRGPTICFEPLPLRAWSKLSITEGDTSIRYIPFKQDQRWGDDD